MGTQVGIVKTTWSGTTGGAGLTQTAFTDFGFASITQAQAQTAVNAVRGFWDAIKAYIPNEVTLTVLPVVDFYDSATNTLNGSVTVGTAPAVVVGADTGQYGMASGLKANLQTTVIAYGRRVRGAIYIVPAGQAAYTNSGLGSSGARTAIDAAGVALIAAMNTGANMLAVWSRARTVPTARAGAVHQVSSVKTNDQTAILRGRRD